MQNYAMMRQSCNVKTTIIAAISAMTRTTKTTIISFANQLTRTMQIWWHYTKSLIWLKSTCTQYATCSSLIISMQGLGREISSYGDGIDRQTDIWASSARDRPRITRTRRVYQARILCFPAGSWLRRRAFRSLWRTQSNHRTHYRACCW